MYQAENHDRKRHIEWLYSIHKSRLNTIEQAVVVLYLNDIKPGKMCKFIHYEGHRLEAMHIEHILKGAISKLW